jgi:predicted metalloendopeptidase
MKTKSVRKKSNNKTMKHRVKLVKAKQVTSNCDIIGLTKFENKLEKRGITTNRNTIRKKFAQQLISSFAPSSIQAKDDFYNYINYNWLKNVTLENKQKYITQIDDFRLAQNKVYDELGKIVTNYINTHNDKLSKNLKEFYKSTKKLISPKYCREITHETIMKIDEFRKDKNNLWKMLGWINRDEMISGQAPFTWTLSPDDKNPEIFRCYIGSFQFPIVDLNVYYDDGREVDYKNKSRNTFKNLIRTVFRTVLSKEDLQDMDTDEVYNVHVDIFNALGCMDVKKNEDNYNRVFANEAMEKYGFNWHEFSKELGFEKTPEFFITNSLNYLKCGTDLLMQNWDSEKWRPFWIWIFIRRNIRLSREYNELYYKYYGDYLRGVEINIHNNQIATSALFLSIPFNTFLTNQYIEKFKNPRVVKYVEIMCHDLKVVFERIIRSNTWLSPSTKKYALLKLKHLKFTIGNPEELREDALLDYTDNLYDNLIKVYLWRHYQFIALEGKKVIDIPYIDWNEYPLKLTGTQAYIVNASYTPSKNGIYINLGYMQKPFIDLDERGIEYNLAHLGFTIGHEMSHSLDDWGSQYDYKGRLYNWWTPKDKENFKNLQKDVIRQYEEWAARDGIKFDASIGIGEDLADISGLAICDQYLRDFQKYNDDILPIRVLSFKVFYVYYSMQMRQKVGKKALLAQLKTNPHPLDKYRTNVPLSRSDYFRSIYNVKRGDGMWWHTINSIW